jgi:hypothetical protein
MSNDCKNNTPCGCEDEALTTPPPCGQGTPECPDPEPCAETFSSDCIIWGSSDLTCDGTVLATSGDRLTTILQRIVNLACTPADVSQSGLGMISPGPDAVIIGAVDRIIAIDRNNCHEIVTFNPVGGPAGLLFNYTDENDVLVSGASGVVLAATQSAVRFDMDISGVAAGVYDFTLEATACGVTVSAAVHLVVS